VPLLARMIATPLSLEVGRGAIAGLDRMLASSRISRDGKVLALVGRGQGEEIADVLRELLSGADVVTVQSASVEHARDLAVTLRQSSYDAVVGIGGGQTLDVAKYVASLVALPMVAVATNLAHDGLASPVASLEYGGHKGSYGVHIPVAVMVDLDYVIRAPRAMLAAGVGDVVSNLSALADWRLAADKYGEPIDGIAAAFARAAAEAIIGRSDSVESAEFLTMLAESLVLSGLAMAVAGSSRPCSGGDHEILHAIDQMFPGAGSHGDLAGVGALFCAYLRGDDAQLQTIDACLRRHQLPRSPDDIGLSVDQFAAAVAFAPTTRPDRYTILEHLDLSAHDIVPRVHGYLEVIGGS
jgi:glycerol-1-phosphate dehydrogenase [NAD(P)+]